MHAALLQSIALQQRLNWKGARPVIVCKFGGTSLCDAARFFRVVEILKKDARRRVVVPSAPGKRFAADTKVTDLLLACHAEGASFAPVRERMREIAAGIGFPRLLDDALEETQARLAQESRDWALSRGEYLSGLLLAALLGWKFLDAAEGIFFGADGRCDMRATCAALRAATPRQGGVVLPGFYGATAEGEIRTFPRGGSDITGAIAAAALDAELYENWTDVPGVHAADPRVVPQARVAASLDYRQLRELSAMGATVLQEEAVFPVREAGIPIAIRSTLEPEKPGTLIQLVQEAARGPAGVAGRKGFIPVTIEKTLLRADAAFARKALEVMERFETPVERTIGGVDSLCILAPRTALEGKEQAVIRALLDALEADSVAVGAPLALVAVVGEMRESESFARVFAALARQGVPVRLIERAPGGRTLLFGVDDADFELAVRAAYRGVFED